MQQIRAAIGSKALLGVGARLVIGGPGGIGKTSVALAIFHSTDLDGCIPRARRFFIPCQSVTTTSTFLSAIASSLDVNNTPGNALKLVISKLKAENIPLMLILDNAESFWFNHGIQPRARTILRHICSIHTVALLLTIRGTERPDVTVWDPLPLLGPLTLLHARNAFLQIAADLEPEIRIAFVIQACYQSDLKRALRLAEKLRRDFPEWGARRGLNGNISMLRTGRTPYPNFR